MVLWSCDAVALAPAPGSAALPLWACGAADLTARMQYTATSFAEPLQRVFDDVCVRTPTSRSPPRESQYLALHVAYRARIIDAFEE